MTTFQDIWRKISGRQPQNETVQTPPAPAQPTSANTLDLDIAPHDPLLAYIVQTGGVLEVDRLRLESPALDQLRQGSPDIAAMLNELRSQIAG